jgi:hypothetical protein
MISLFFGLKFCTNVKNKYEKGIIMLQHFPISFGLAKIKKKK